MQEIFNYLNSNQGQMSVGFIGVIVGFLGAVFSIVFGSKPYRAISLVTIFLTVLILGIFSVGNGVNQTNREYMSDISQSVYSKYDVTVTNPDKIFQGVKDSTSDIVIVKEKDDNMVHVNISLLNPKDSHDVTVFVNGKELPKAHSKK